jgi:two-component system, OmpR family, sensor histidine kinase QseC
MTSLRRLLMLSLLSTIGGATVVSTVLSYRDGRIEAAELFDAKLAQSARVLRAMSERSLDGGADLPLRIALFDRDLAGRGADLVAADGHAYETKLAFQVVSSDGALLLVSDNAPDAALAPLVAGFDERRIGDETWRTFALAGARGRWFLAAERSDIRDELAGEIALGTALPHLLALPLLALLVALIVNWGVRSIARVAADVEQRPAERLEPIDPGRVPLELKGLVVALNGLFARVAAAIGREQRFTADAAHELRTPISALKLHAQNLAGSRDEEQRQASLDGLMRGIRRCERLVVQLLQMNRLERSGERIALAGCDLGRIVRDSAAEVAPEALARGCELLVEAPESMGLHGDATLLGVLVRNLVDNAIRHGGQGGKVRVTLGSTGEGILLAVEDQGPGVPTAERVAVFERFRRGEGALTPGSGLGLSIAARVVELHRGHIELADRAGGPGLVVRVYLPAAG